MTDTLQTDLFQTQIPENFIAVDKSAVAKTGEFRNENICRQCDARKLCQDPDWCKKYPCMSWNRTDGKSVVYKIKQKQ